MAPGDLVFDVGANVGRRTQRFLSLGARVVCVEPQASCLEVLRERFGRHPDVIIVPEAVGERPGFMDLMVCQDAPTLSTLSDDWVRRGRFAAGHAWGKRERVAVTTLEDLVARYGLPAFLKIDIEGFERQALQGLRSAVGALSFEYTREFLDEARACADMVAARGRYRFNATIGEAAQFALPHWVSGEELCRFLGARPEMDLWGDVFARS